MMLTLGVGDGIPYGSWGNGSYGHENEHYGDDYDDASEEDYDGSEVEVDDDDAFGVHARSEGEEDDYQTAELDPSLFSCDEAFARALQDSEEREMAARMFALSGMNEMVVGDDEDVDEDEEEQAGILPDTWEEVDPDELSYEELIALGEVVGTESRVFLQIQ
ncbi:RING-type E3 ubiquitin transferase [Salvia divinorum]|uniref:RING-type E3 ubiquitin transferase n=1 Tax=Salvia divinorum TaxID=28513 RepID=A0ABD1IK96_SALDI